MDLQPFSHWLISLAALESGNVQHYYFFRILYMDIDLEMSTFALLSRTLLVPVFSSSLCHTEVGPIKTVAIRGRGILVHSTFDLRCNSRHCA